MRVHPGRRVLSAGPVGKRPPPVIAGQAVQAVLLFVIKHVGQGARHRRSGRSLPSATTPNDWMLGERYGL